MPKVILDVDPGIDDTLAIIFACLAPKIELLGLCIVAGNVSLEKGARNALHALHAAGDWKTPIFLGASQPLERKHIPAEETHGGDGFGALHGTPQYQQLQQDFCTYYDRASFDDEQQIRSQSAKDFLSESLKAQPGEITILALGPLTNLAEQQNLDKAKQILLMGGTARHHGNCSPVAEYNFWVDPHAAQQVFAKQPVTMVGLDVTHKLVFSPNIREIVRMFPHPLAPFIYHLTRAYIDFHWQQERTIGCVINDPLVPVGLLYPDILSYYKAHVEVCTAGPAIGQSVVDFAGFWHDGQHNAQVAMQVNAHKFFQYFLTVLFPENTEEIGILLQKEFKAF